MTKFFYFLCSILCSISVCGQVVLRADTDKFELAQNSPLRFTVVLEISGDKMEQETKLRLPDLSKFNYLGDGSEQNTFIDPRRGIVVNQQVFQFELSPKMAGKIKIGSATVQVNGKIYKSEPFEITVTPEESSRTTEKSSENHMRLSLEIQNKEVYKNQPVTAVLRAYSEDYSDFRKLNNVKFPAQQSISVEPISIQDKYIERDNDTSSQVLGAFLVYPNKSGVITIPSASAVYNSGGKNFRIKSNSVKIFVKNFPQKVPENFRNAVGDFNVSVENLASEDAEINKPLDVLVKISGKGNLSAATLPPLKKSPDYTFYRPKISERLRKTNRGNEGEVFAKYVVIPKIKGNLNISTEDFAFFNPEKKKYVQLGEKSIILPVLSEDEASDQKTAIEKVNAYTNNVLKTVNNAGIKTEKFRIKEEKEFSWRTIFLNYGLLFLLFSLIWYFISFRITGKKKIRLNAEKPTHYQPEINLSEKIAELQKAAFRGDHDLFFAKYDELEESVESQIQIAKKMPLRDFLEQKKGIAVAERFRTLQQRIQMERYAPQHFPEQIDEILRNIKIVFSDLSF